MYVARWAADDNDDGDDNSDDDSDDDCLYDCIDDIAVVTMMTYDIHDDIWHSCWPAAVDVIW